MLILFQEICHILELLQSLLSFMSVWDLCVLGSLDKSPDRLVGMQVDATPWYVMFHCILSTCFIMYVFFVFDVVDLLFIQACAEFPVWSSELRWMWI